MNPPQQHRTNRANISIELRAKRKHWETNPSPNWQTINFNTPLKSSHWQMRTSKNVIRERAHHLQNIIRTSRAPLGLGCFAFKRLNNRKLGRSNHNNSRFCIWQSFFSLCLYGAAKESEAFPNFHGAQLPDSESEPFSIVCHQSCFFISVDSCWFGDFSAGWQPCPGKLLFYSATVN